MKITIELEIQPDEVSLASELLSTLRTLTDHVTVKPAANGVAPAAAAPAAPAPAAAAPAAAAPAPAAPAPVAAPAAPAAAAPAAASAAAALPQLPPGVPQAFTTIVPRLGNPATQLQAIADAVATLSGAGEQTDKAIEDLVEALDTQVFQSPEVIGNPAGVMPYMALYQRLPEELQPRLRDRLVPRVLKALTRKRAVNADRTQFFLYADAFATLVKFEAVAMPGAVQTLQRLLDKPDNRCAGITMLGKTVEYCGEQLLKAPEATLGALWRSMEGCTEEAFRYDLQYIFGTLQALLPPNAALPGLGAGAPAAPEAAGAAPASSVASSSPTPPATGAAGGASVGGAAATSNPALKSVQHVGVYSGHSSTVFTLAYDAANGALASGSQDGRIIVWGPDGQPANHMDFPSHFICSLDFLPRTGTLLAAGVPTPDAAAAPEASSCVAAWTPPAGRARGVAWPSRGRVPVSKPGGLMSFARALGGGEAELVAVGENLNLHGAAAPAAQPGQDVVTLYDLARGTPLEQSQPLLVWAEHLDMVTCGTPWHASPHVFVSGGRDCAIKLWDTRTPQSVGAFGTLDPGSGRVMAHSDMITCLDTTDNLLISTSTDASMGVWDFRALGSMGHGSSAPQVVKMQIDQQPCLKVAVAGAPHSRLAAISTYQGLYVMDLSNMTAPATLMVPPLTDGRPFAYYHDIRWAGGPGGPGQPVLFGASNDPRIDLFSVSF
ncbi:hypothetical protein HYH02_002988 [Chlamydomonas schloesseri]|uniref:Guanine nucleotide-binding protein subunit beta-like protein n=1 Tax=Chlamydomonas schloesseri TaxID=2026947 RepID=A0A835WRG3_9CHLO|nr:hypothetical protein HYH02_002988 [Chlamydomonas schloesseri]|eukprot:KAG2452758.1 hypothetical protein HYH02_002988 [Chlamydomonas schloesseri]